MVRLIKTAKIIIALFAVVLVTVLFFALRYRSHRTIPEGGSPQISNPSYGSIKSKFVPLQPAKKVSVVRFSSESVKQAFIKANGLTDRDVIPAPGLVGTYTVNKPPSDLTAAGALVSEQKTYTALLTPNDPTYPQWYTTKISAPSAWDISTGSSTTIVADIDTGFALNHEDLVGRWATGGYDFVHSDSDPSAGTSNPTGAAVNHGTVIAGLLGATGNNAKGVASINWSTKILPIQVLDDDGNGTTTNVAAGIDYAVNHGANVINLSLGTTGDDTVVDAAVDYARAHDVVVVAAAGNCGDPATYTLNGCSQVGQMIYPANYSPVLAVGATDSTDARASFSSYGANLDVMAPGTDSITTTNWTSGNQTSAYTSNESGTSLASPIVAGLAALYRGTHPSASAVETMNAIINNTDKVSGMAGQNFTSYYGYGRVNAVATLSNGVNACGHSPFDSAISSYGHVPGDYSGDGVADAAVFRPSDGCWHVRGYGDVLFGQSGDIPVPADYNGDGRTDIAIYRPSEHPNGEIMWHIRGVGDYGYGHSGDIPVPADYNGDGTADVAVYRPSETINGQLAWHIRGVGDFGFGQPGDIPMPFDYNGDGKADIAVFRPSSGDWHIRGVGDYAAYGQDGDIPAPGDYPGFPTGAIFRPTDGGWRIRAFTDFPYGISTDIPVPSDYNGDRRTDAAVFRPTYGDWHLRGVGDIWSYGQSGDIPAIQTLNALLLKQYGLISNY